MTTLALALLAGAPTGLGLDALAWRTPRWPTRVLPPITFSHG